MKILRLTVILLVTIGFGFLASGCNSFKLGKKGGAEGEGDTVAQTSGLGEQESFGDEAISPENRLKAPYNQSYLFGFDRYDVQPEDVASINVQANHLAANAQAKVRLEGNTDARGSREYNIALGWKRAKAVADILKQQGVNQEQIVMVSYGKEKPIALGHDEDSYGKNRRTDLIYEAK